MNNFFCINYKFYIMIDVSQGIDINKTSISTNVIIAIIGIF